MEKPFDVYNISVRLLMGMRYMVLVMYDIIIDFDSDPLFGSYIHFLTIQHHNGMDIKMGKIH